MKLSSFSGVKNAFKPIDEATLKFIEPYTNEGKMFMKAIEDHFNFGTDIENDLYDVGFKAIMKVVEGLGDKILEVEKLVELDKKGKGYIDLVGEKYFYEIKVRSSAKYEDDTIYQCEHYKKLLGKDKYCIIIINRVDGSCDYKTNDMLDTKHAEKVVDTIGGLKDNGKISKRKKKDGN